MCGPTSAQTSAFATNQKITNLLTSDMQLIAGNNTNILNSMMTALSPQVQMGPNQFGFSPAQEAAQRTMATEQMASANQNEVNAVRNSVAARGGMNLPSGSEASIEAGLAQDTAQKQAEAQLGITEKGYEVGRENFFQSAQMLGALPAELENPMTSSGSAALGGSEAEMQGATQMQQAQDAWMAPVAGMIGAVGGAYLGNLGKTGGGNSGGENPFAPAGSIPAAANGGTFIPGVCWVAAEVFGNWYDPRTILVRKWLNTEFKQSFVGRLVMALYTRFGQTWALWVRTNRLIRTIATALMNRALSKATKKCVRNNGK